MKILDNILHGRLRGEKILLMLMVTSLYPEAWDLISFFILALITTSFTAGHKIIQLTLKFSCKIEHFDLPWLYQFLWTYDFGCMRFTQTRDCNLRRSCWRSLKAGSGMRPLRVHPTMVPTKKKCNVFPRSYLVNWDSIATMARPWIQFFVCQFLSLGLHP